MKKSRVTVGVDEVGRGCLAGPVVAAAVIIPDSFHALDWILEVRDSKKLSPKKRQYLSSMICQDSIWAIREVPARMVDEMNILNATLRAMNMAVNSVISQGGNPGLVLVDGNRKIPDIGLPQETIIGGDDVMKDIGAASIIAKVYRDKLMVDADLLYPEYGFAQHKGYGTKQHRQAIMEYGVTPLHRKTFKGVSEYVI